MNLNKLLKILFSLLFLLLLGIFVTEVITKPNNVSITINEIKRGYKGEIIDKYALRDTEPTHLKLMIEKGKIIDISPNQQIVSSANIGDSLIKPRNENIAYLKSKDSIEKFFYTRLSYETRQDKRFPKKWRNKWMESSKWDKKTAK